MKLPDPLNALLDAFYEGDPGYGLTGRYPWYTAGTIKEGISALRRVLKDFIPEKNTSAYHLFFHCDDFIPFEFLPTLLYLLSQGHKIYYLPAERHPITEKIFQSLSVLMETFSAFTPQKKEMTDAYITGMHFTAPDQDRYFDKKPSLFLPRTGAVGILTGKENLASLQKLAKDIVSFFGTGKGNVKKLFVPEGYHFQTLLNCLDEFCELKDYHPYNNRYRYASSIYLLHRQPFFDNQFLIIKEDTTPLAPVACVFYETYTDEQMLEEKVNHHRKVCYSIYSEEGWFKDSLPFGNSSLVNYEVDKRVMTFIQNGLKGA